jgi:predicted nuclease of predicted toxin-antitoxin system
MRLLANENLPRAAVDVLRSLGHEVRWIAEECPSVRDEYVLDLAVREARVLVTQDKDFGELAFRRGLPASSGIVLLRVAPVPGRVTELARKVFGEHADFRGKFVVVEEGRMRERPLPTEVDRR